MRVLGAHSSSPSHTLKRIVRRSATSPPSLAILSASGTGRYRTPAPPDDVQLLQAFRPCELGSVQTGGGNQIDRFQEGPHGAPPCGPFYSRLWPASFASAIWAMLPPDRNHIAIRFRAHEGRLRRSNNRHCRKSRPLRSEPTSLWLVLNIIQRPGPEGHPNHQKLDPRFLCGVCMIRLTAACI